MNETSPRRNILRRAAAFTLATSLIVAEASPSAASQKQPDVQTGQRTTPSLATTEAPTTSVKPESKLYPRSVYDLINNQDQSSVSPKDVSASVELAWDNNPKLEAMFPRSRMQQILANCQNGLPGDKPEDIKLSKIAACIGGTNLAYGLHHLTGDPNLFATADLINRYGRQSLGSDYTQSAHALLELGYGSRIKTPIR